eukprot:PhF_6_TR8998/c0_g1_i1/m.14122
MVSLNGRRRHLSTRGLSSRLVFAQDGCALLCTSLVWYDPGCEVWMWPFTVGTGVLQGDTLAPYLFVIVLDSVLRKLDEKHGILLSKPAPKLTKRQAAFIAPPEKRLNALAFADDVCLLSHTRDGLQQLFSTFESLALQTGLRINMGKGKTERVSSENHLESLPTTVKFQSLTTTSTSVLSFSTGTLTSGNASRKPGAPLSPSMESGSQESASPRNDPSSKL